MASHVLAYKGEEASDSEHGTFFSDGRDSLFLHANGFIGKNCDEFLPFLLKDDEVFRSALNKTTMSISKATASCFHYCTSC